ncbi:hypothetical protein PVAP13_5KG570907 [Panicum virgatum]|uniref:Uncharacterized protein n=1 Tax=Panicum virgatum TaxID=38727 RepID=A0A8T0SYB0_PANVG|nr:hypothetical protein PVAP13_5KG570907 [Panicum virgatum]
MTRRSRGKRRRASPDAPAKRRRGGPPEREADDYPEPAPAPEPAAQQPPSVMVAGLPPGCGVLGLKSRLEAYGPIARARRGRRVRHLPVRRGRRGRHCRVPRPRWRHHHRIQQGNGTIDGFILSVNKVDFLNFAMRCCSIKWWWRGYFSSICSILIPKHLIRASAVECIDAAENYC